jgi:hypothetical protein
MGVSNRLSKPSVDTDTAAADTAAAAAAAAAAAVGGLTEREEREEREEEEEEGREEEKEAPATCHGGGICETDREVMLLLLRPPSAPSLRLNQPQAKVKAGTYF